MKGVFKKWLLDRVSCYRVGRMIWKRERFMIGGARE